MTENRVFPDDGMPENSIQEELPPEFSEAVEDIEALLLSAMDELEAGLSEDIAELDGIAEETASSSPPSEPAEPDPNMEMPLEPPVPRPVGAGKMHGDFVRDFVEKPRSTDINEPAKKDGHAGLLPVFTPEPKKARTPLADEIRRRDSESGLKMGAARRLHFEYLDSTRRAFPEPPFRKDEPPVDLRLGNLAMDRLELRIDATVKDSVRNSDFVRGAFAGEHAVNEKITPLEKTASLEKPTAKSGESGWHSSEETFSLLHEAKPARTKDVWDKPEQPEPPGRKYPRQGESSRGSMGALDRKQVESGSPKQKETRPVEQSHGSMDVLDRKPVKSGSPKQKETQSGESSRGSMDALDRKPVESGTLTKKEIRTGEQSRNSIDALDRKPVESETLTKKETRQGEQSHGLMDALDRKPVELETLTKKETRLVEQSRDSMGALDRKPVESWPPEQKEARRPEPSLGAMDITTGKPIESQPPKQKETWPREKDLMKMSTVRKTLDKAQSKQMESKEKTVVSSSILRVLSMDFDIKATHDSLMDMSGGEKITCAKNAYFRLQL